MVALKYFYDTDILEIRKNKKETMHYSMRFGHFVFDFSSTKKLVGVEILEASKHFGVPKKYLKDNVVDSKLTVLNQPGAVGFKIKIVFLIEKKKQVKDLIINVPPQEEMLAVEA